MSLEKKSGGATRGRGRFKASWKWMPGNVLDSLVCASLGEGEKEKEKKKREVVRSGRDWPDYVFFFRHPRPESEAEKVRVGSGRGSHAHPPSPTPQGMLALVGA